MRTIELAQTQSGTKKEPLKKALNLMAGTTRLELATSCVTGMRSNQTELRSHAFIMLSVPFDKFYYIMLKKNLQEFFYSKFYFFCFSYLYESITAE